ncbi:ATP-binding protein [Pedobacter duraquae]|uniref:histidine kinase n=1 Tax=Pedobacter duraquae TaxID=425511 RepID=A0A4R6IHP8_9SPHI|nr:ATP-binding protein [Pedobacter duraquae]TDO20815.1 signal transduction histidine kinase [Pedobacter duraquae]
MSSEWMYRYFSGMITLPLRKHSLSRYLFKFFLFCLLFLPVKPLLAQQQPLILSADTLAKYPKGQPLQHAHWFYKQGDNPHWRSPNISDNNWTPVSTNFGSNKLLAGWSGIGWFRLWISSNNSFQNKMLGLRINHDGASEIYLDGKQIGGYGKVGKVKSNIVAARAAYTIVPFLINDGGPHLLAIRYSNPNNYFPEFIGFETWLGTYQQMSAAASVSMQRNDLLLISAGAQLALALLHIFLFVWYPKQKQNLIYSLFVLFSASTIVIRFVIYDTTDPALQAVANNVFSAVVILSTFAIGLLFYAVSYTVLPKWRIIILASVTSGLLIYLTYLSVDCGCAVANKLSPILNLYYLLVNIDGIRAIIVAIRKRKPGVWLIGLGMFILALFFFIVGVNFFGLFEDEELINQWMSLGLLVLPVCFSIYLALDFARTNRNLSLQLQHVQQLSELNATQEAEKLRLITEQAQQLEYTVVERTTEVMAQAEKLREMDAVKSRFMINLTHEFRTPLTLILGPIKQILTRVTDKQTIVQANTIQRNAERLLQLITQMLDLTKLEAGKMELSNTPTELIILIRRNFLSFESLANEKQIDLRFLSDWEILWLLIDKNKVEMIVLNLLSNAVKFTNSKGQIILSLRKNADLNWLELKIRDTGVGIPKGKLPFIFDRFYQADPSDSRSHEGTGIGLAITKELVTLLGGNMALNSIEGKGTEVTVHLPINETAAVIEQEKANILESSVSRGQLDHIELTNIDKELPLILVIEDNPELRDFIGSILHPVYRVLQASNGEEGLNIGIAQIPDLVITDLMMPIMDGYQVCSEFKQNEKTSHIPVIILTAKSGIENRITGLEIMADAYLDKPFDERELFITIKNLIAIRKQLQQQYGKTDAWLGQHADLPAMEKVFLDRVLLLVETHLDDERYSVELLADDMNLSRTQLHRKLKAVIAQSPGDLIRIVRLQHAYELLRNKVGTVADISYMVGYGNPKNFSTSFSKHFGFSPTEASNH